ncbi:MULTISPECIES: Imm63 family immunity protein [Ottowia]|jgi:hypothetical protein|uniref:Imm63 family immunity protein n=1 Tax=Ottowia TaxID=219181 RepID=UPI0006827BD7|nr:MULTISPECIES: Imm63 family immunity protein [Ottowia]
MNINQIRQQIKAYGAMIDAPPQMLTVFDQPQGDGTPFVVVDEGGYRYIFEERGMIFEERKTKDGEQLLYWIMEIIISNMAYSYELEHRDPQRDPRRIAFAKELELFGIINKSWRQLKKSKLDEILKNNPFDDEVMKRRLMR